MKYFFAAMFIWGAFLNYSRGGVLIMNQDPTARKFYAGAFMVLALMSIFYTPESKKSALMSVGRPRDKDKDKNRNRNRNRNKYRKQPN
jgi:hypothetical protein